MGEMMSSRLTRPCSRPVAQATKVTRVRIKIIKRNVELEEALLMIEKLLWVG